ncbi:murein L,D-transpeptidase catalytic domain family protein [Sphingomonas sp. M1-B02]|uniref:murein L,D-transpeptidase catalytic domain family protein n=1 Tax=Sphingomonas sp. M1-B02 TaxID=3114300 RepID=UPI00223FBBCD|nr:murein L,D-transpeptidase catalytic domain family protein [Sphingomonas sp. S6-11]UZK66600.1 murein L,D-transpeptidase catalytic domain family protein [Sphingomonas sp. S6-11]
MTQNIDPATTRRALIKSAFVIASGAAVTACVSRTTHVASAPPLAVPSAAPIPSAPAVAAKKLPTGIRPELVKRAVAALDRHSMRVPSHDRIAIADFAAPSYRPRFHLVHLGSGTVESFLVAHGIGSDPEHTGLLHRFSNEVNSEATCEGAFLTDEYYVGKHGHSQRLRGLDPTNNNAYDRAIVVHSSWYANSDMIAKHGKLGRSQGCFAVGEQELAKVFERLGPGRMIYSAKV